MRGWGFGRMLRHGEVGQQRDGAMLPGPVIVAPIGGHQRGVAQIERDGMVQRVEQMVVKLDRQRAGVAVDVKTVSDGDLHDVEEGCRLRRDVRLEANTDG